jgi:hypothetical protein
VWLRNTIENAKNEENAIPGSAQVGESSRNGELMKSEYTGKTRGLMV